MTADAPNLTLVVLAYNEESSVRDFLVDCLAFLDTQPGEHEIIVVDDGSTDRTGAEVREVAHEDPRIRLVTHPRNLGIGAGMRSGFAHARGSHLSVLAADGQVRAWALERLIPHLETAPIVLSVYRRRPHELYRVGLSRGLRALMKILLGISFKLEGIYVFPVAVARDEIGLDTIGADTFFFSFELISRALALGYSTATVTIDPLPRASGASKVANLRAIARVTEELLRFRLRLFREGELCPGRPLPGILRSRAPRTPPLGSEGAAAAPVAPPGQDSGR